MAKSKRRGEDAVDGRLEDVLDEDALTDDLADEDLDADLSDDEVDDEVDADADLSDDEVDDDLVDADDEEPESGRSRTAVRRRSSGSPKKVARKSTKTRDFDRVGVYARLRNFVREVVAELRKVIWPTRKELLTYTAVVIVFVTIMFSVVASLDYGFGKAMFLIFGNKK